MRNSPKAILLVDDNLNLTKSMSLILKRKGYEVETAKSGLEALDTIKRKSFVIIFMDIKMPYMNGVETFKQLKQISPEAIVILMTAYSVEELVQEALEAGAYGILYKPLDIEKIIGLVQDSISNQKGAFILIVDDDFPTRRNLQRMLHKEGYRVAVSKDGEEAIRICEKNHFDVLIIDIKLPTINGLEVYHSIKMIKPETVAIMITGYGKEVPDLVQQALDDKAYACLFKPLDMAEVLKLVEEIYRKQGNAE